MEKMGLKELKSRKSGIWGQSNVFLALPGPKQHRFGALEAFFFFFFKNSMYNSTRRRFFCFFSFSIGI